MIGRILIALLLIAGSAEATEYFAGPSGSGSTCSSGSPCTIQTGLGKLTAGDILTLQSGTYQGSSQMLNLGGFVSGVSGTAGGSSTCGSAAVACTPITVRAQTDGGVFIDGQFARRVFVTFQNSYWTFQGFDVGNSSDASASLMEIRGGDHNTFQRICASNSQVNPPPPNVHVVLNWDSSNNLYEDICAFGTGRNTFQEYSDLTTGGGSQRSINNTYRRMWIRWEGFSNEGSLCGGGPGIQNNYGVGVGNQIWENIIAIHSSEQQQVGWSPCYAAPGSYTTGTGQPSLGGARSGGYGYRDNTLATVQNYYGWILYGIFTEATYNSYLYPLTQAWFPVNHLQSLAGSAQTINMTDMFVDGRSQPVPPFVLGCDNSPCHGNATRLTGLRSSLSGANWVPYNTTVSDFGAGLWSTSNTNECTSPTGCPDFYTGSHSGGALGARNCFRYVNGTLTSTPLWPWPMDDRIKAALARAAAAGTGGSALTGSSGSGYAANTVTSEIVSRYGSVPSACLSGSSFTPSFPVASDFPSIAVLDTFDRSNSSTLGANWTVTTGTNFTIASNQAAAPIDFTRELYTGSQATGTFHEAAATWTTAHPCCGFTTMIVFAAQAISDNSQWRLYFNRQSGGNTQVEIRRIDSGGSSTTLGSTIDLGTDFADNDGFGVRVDTSTSTISAYWKWHGDGQWYRIGQRTDATLPTGNVYGGFAGISPAVINDFVFGPPPTSPPVCPPICPPNPSTDPSSGVGRFGTTFPGVR